MSLLAVVPLGAVLPHPVAGCLRTGPVRSMGEQWSAPTTSWLVVIVVALVARALTGVPA